MTNNQKSRGEKQSGNEPQSVDALALSAAAIKQSMDENATDDISYGNVYKILLAGEVMRVDRLSEEAEGKENLC